MDYIDEDDEKVLKKVQNLAKTGKDPNVMFLRVSPPSSPGTKREEDMYKYKVESKDELFADLKKKRQNVMSNTSSKSSQGFKIIQVTSPSSAFGIQPTKIGITNQIIEETNELNASFGPDNNRLKVNKR